MAKTCVGIDIGTSEIKFAVVSGGKVQRVAVRSMPDNLLREGRIISPETMADFMKETAKEEKINAKSAAVILPSAVAFTRRITLPMMTHDQLVLNLPYEFRDYITQEKDKYFYDYAVIGRRLDEETGEAIELDIIAAATLKETIQDYSWIVRRAGFKLEVAVPEEIAYMNIIRDFERRYPQEKTREYAFIDIGHTGTRLQIFNGIAHEATRVMEMGAALLDDVIAERYNVDEHIASAYKHANNNGELMLEGCQNVYSAIGVEIVRALNFYNFNNPTSELSEVFLCGGGAQIAPLVDLLRSELDKNVYTVNELLPESAKQFENSALCQLAIGITLA